jgi:NhaP-type Na+/H+ or K+/H+ antiporter
VCLLTGGALVVGFLSGVGLTALALYGVVWAVLVGLVGGLPLNPVDEELSQLDPPE